MNFLLKYFGFGKETKSLNDIIQDVSLLKADIKERIHADSIGIEIIDTEIDMLNRDKQHKEIDINTANKILSNLSGVTED